MLRVRISLSMGSFLMERILRSTPNGVLTTHAEWLPGVRLGDAVHIENCEGWWLSGRRSSVVEHWWLKPELSWVQLPAAAGLFTFLYFCFITFISSMQEARCSGHHKCCALDHSHAKAIQVPIPLFPRVYHPVFDHF